VHGVKVNVNEMIFTDVSWIHVVWNRTRSNSGNETWGYVNVWKFCIPREAIRFSSRTGLQRAGCKINVGRKHLKEASSRVLFAAKW
jgi:hypothetical protein